MAQPCPSLLPTSGSALPTKLKKCRNTLAVRLQIGTALSRALSSDEHPRSTDWGRQIARAAGRSAGVVIASVCAATDGAEVERPRPPGRATSDGPSASVIIHGLPPIQTAQQQARPRRSKTLHVSRDEGRLRGAAAP